MNNHNEEGNCTNEERKLSFTWPDITSAFIICIPSTIGRGNPTSAISNKKDARKSDDSHIAFTHVPKME